MSERRRTRPAARSAVRVAAWVTAWVAAAVLAALTLAVVTGSPLLAVDDAVARAVAAHRPPPLAAAASALTWLGSAAVLVPLTVVVAVTARARTGTGSWRPGAALALAAVGAWASMAVLKDLIARPRPDGGLVAAGGYAFPSGHSADAAAWWVTAALLVTWWVGPRRRGALRGALVGAGVAVAALVGVTRVVLGVHHATDVVAGWSLGALWVVVAAALLSRGRPSGRALANARPPS